MFAKPQQPFIEPNFGENKASKYQKLEKVGNGTYGIVYKAKDNDTNDIVAMKKMILGIENEGVPSTALREISLLREIQHSNVVGLRDIVIENQKLYLVFEYIDKDLKRFMESIGSDFLTLGQVKSFLYQILLGIAACHSRRILHRDLKPQNLLIGLNGTLKIADFGLARTFTIPIRPYTHEVVTLWYRAPEILLGSIEYSTSIDIWSIGCIFAEMVTKIPLFAGDSEIDQLFRIFRVLGTPTEENWPGVSQLKEYRTTFPNFSVQSLESMINVNEMGIDLLKRMLKYDPTDRISAKSAINHPFFDDIRNNFGSGQFF